MTPSEQAKMVRVAQVVEAYAERGIAISCDEVDNWAGFMSTQISAMARRKTLGPHYTYRIKILNTGEEITEEFS